METLARERVRRAVEEVMGPAPSEILGKTCSIFMKIVESSSQEGAFLVHLFGLKLGEKLGQELKDLESDPWNALSEVLECIGIAESSDIIARGYSRATLRIRYSDEYRRKLMSCSFLKGMTSGFLSGISGKYFSGREVSCSEEGVVLEIREIQEERCVEPPRRAIMEYLRANPGAHMRQIARDLGMSLGSLRWHLNVLEKRGLIRERRKGNLTEFYPSELAT